MSETKPTFSKGALRAAFVIETLIHPLIGDDKCPGATRLSQIIHDKTRQDAVQELLEAAKTIVEAGPKPIGIGNFILVEKLKAAIRKVEEE